MFETGTTATTPLSTVVSISSGMTPAPTTHVSGASETSGISSSVTTGIFGTGTTASFASTTGSVTGTTTKICDEMQAVTESLTKKITVTPSDVAKEEFVKFQPTSSEGVKFPESNKQPIITVTFDTPARVQSITIPRNQTTDANVDKFQVTFYGTDGNKINETPTPTEKGPSDDKNKPARLDITDIPSNQLLSRVEIQVISTTDNTSPKGVVLDIKACTEPTTG